MRFIRGKEHVVEQAKSVGGSGGTYFNYERFCQETNPVRFENEKLLNYL